MAISAYISIIILNVNRLNAPIKDIGWLNGLKYKTCLYATTKDNSVLNKHRLKVKRWKKLFHEYGN